MGINSTTYFQHDGAPCHTAKVVKEWINNQSSFQLLHPWPGNSPDLNPIENCWAKLKEKVALTQIDSYAVLVERIKKIWATQISSDYCKKLVESMPDRINECF